MIKNVETKGLRIDINYKYWLMLPIFACMVACKEERSETEQEINNDDSESQIVEVSYYIIDNSSGSTTAARRII